jgi:hypothetical protein
MANTLNLGDGNWATKEDSLLGYNSENNNYKPLPFDFSRSSLATRINKDGLIETVGGGKPRIDFLGNTKGALLLEPEATNLVTYSEDFSQWDMSNTSYSPNQTISPDGTLNSAKIIPNTNNVQHYTYFQGSAMNNNQSWSIFVKAENYSNISITSGSISTGFEVKFDLSLGTVHSAQGAAYESSKIESIGNGWYRCSVVSSRTSGSWLQIYVLDDSHNSIFQGDGTSGIYLWGGQTVNSSVTTSYIPTYGSTVTRVAEFCNGAGNTSTFNDSQGVLYAEVKGFEEVPSDSGYIVLSSPTISFTNAVVLQFRDNGGLRLYVGGSASANIQFIDSTIDFTENNKIAVQYDSNGSNYKMFVNGVSISRYSLATNQSVTGLSELNLNYSTLGFIGEVKDVRVYNNALTDAQLQALTQ